MNPLTTLIKETTQFLEQPAKVAKEVLDIIELPTKPAEMLINSLAHVSTQATAGRQEEDEMREPDPSTLDLSGYDDLYLCHSALALRIKRDTANQEELTSRGSALNQCQQALDASTTELQQLRLRLDDLGVTATNGAAAAQTPFGRPGSHRYQHQLLGQRHGGRVLHPRSLS